jgi:hypothetical protein
MKLISISGNATCGKDRMCKYILEELGGDAKRYAFADVLKDEVDDFLKKTLGVSAWTSDPVEKEMIRPFLVFWGTDFRRNLDPEYWIKKLDQQLSTETAVITDLRYLNEYEYVRSFGGKVIYLDRQITSGVTVGPANSHEAKNNSWLKLNADVCATWLTYPETPKGEEQARLFVQKNIIPHL